MAARRKRSVKPSAPSPLDFLQHLVWLDGRPLIKTVERYRKRLLMDGLYSFDADGRPRHNLVLSGRAKKNWKTTDLVLACLYRFLVWPSAHGNDCFILANDEGQAADDLSLTKKLIEVNPIVARDVEVRSKEITRRDGKGKLMILPARDVAGAHGKTYLFVGFDEIHAYKDHGLFEALAPDPSRPDALTWITSYAGLHHRPGVPLHDFLELGKSGGDPRMLLSWYSGDFTSDPNFRDLEPEARANPSVAGFSPDYLAQQRRRLPSGKFRRLHLNLPGAPEGAALDSDAIVAAVAPRRKRLGKEDGRRYRAFVDMSGGSSDDATLAIAHFDQERKVAVLDLVERQAGRPPFNPRAAVAKFAALLGEYGLRAVTGDHYGGLTFRQDFEAHGIAYSPCREPKSSLYEALEPRLNAREVELLDLPDLVDQLISLVWRGSKIDHEPGGHDDFANAAAGAINLVIDRADVPLVSPITEDRINGWDQSWSYA